MMTQAEPRAAATVDLDEVILAYLKAEDAGCPPSPHEWIERHPQLADELRAFFDLDNAPYLGHLQHTNPIKAFGDYRDLQIIGRGGMGVVFKAYQNSLQRHVALKMIRDPHLAEPETIARFLTEAQNVSRVEHANVVKIYQVGEHQGMPFFSMEYIAGGSLAGRMTPGQPLAATLADQRAAVRLLIGVAEAVHHAHQRGIIHRDLKPANILLKGGVPPSESVPAPPTGAAPDTVPDQPKDALPQVTSPPPVSPLGLLNHVDPFVTDFGLAKLLEEQAVEGTIAGTPSYMAPEQAAGQGDLTTAVDVYGLGAVLYELLTGVPPFRAATAAATLALVTGQAPVKPQRYNRAVDGDLASICLKCLAKDPAQRYGSARELGEEWQRWLAGEPIERTRQVGRVERGWKWAQRRPALAGLVALATAVVVVGMPVLVWLWANALEAGHARERQHYATRIRYAGGFLADDRIEAGELDPLEQELGLCPPRHRSWEWHYLLRHCHRETVVLSEHRRAVQAVRFSPDGRRFASAGDDGRVLLWDRANLAAVELPGSTAAVESLGFGGGGRWLAYAGPENRLRLWDVAAGKEFARASVAACWVSATPNGARLATLSAGHEVTVWQVYGCELVACRTFPKPDKNLLCVAISPDGRLVAVGGVQEYCRVWEVDTGCEVPLPSVHTPGRTGDVFRVAFSGDSAFLAVDAAPVVMIDLHRGKRINEFFGTNAMRCNDLVFLPTQSQLAATFPDCRLRVWDSDSGNPVLMRQHGNVNLEGVDFSPDGAFLVFTAGRDLVLCPLRPAHNERNRRLRPDGDAECWAAALSPEGTTLAAHAGDRAVRLWDAETGDLLATVPTRGRLGRGRALAFCPQGRWLAAGSDADALELWDLRPPLRRAAVTIPAADARLVAFSPQGELVATSTGKGIDVWDLHTGDRVGSWPDTYAVACLAFLPSGEELAFGCSDASVYVWAVRATAFRRSNGGHRGGVTALALDPRGRRIVSTGPDLVIRTWDVADLDPGAPIEKLPCFVERLLFTPDGRRVVAGRSDGWLSVWDVDTGAELLALPGHQKGLISSLSCDRAGVLATSGRDGVVRLWDGRPLEK